MKKQWFLSGFMALAMGVPMVITPQPLAYAAEMTAAQKNALMKKYMKALHTERNQYNRAKAAKELGILGDARALPQLHKTLVTDVSPQVRINSAYAIGRINQKSSVKKLLMALGQQKGIKSNQVDVLLAIIQAIGDMGEAVRLDRLKGKETYTIDSHTVSSLRRLLGQPSPFIREAAVESLWKIRDYSVSKSLIYLLATEAELIVKLTLVQYIADFKDARAIPVLDRLIKDPKEHIDVKAMAQDAKDKLEIMEANGTLRVKDRDFKMPPKPQKK